MKATLLLGLGLLLPLARPSSNDFEDQRVVSPSGRRYVVVRKIDLDAVSFELCVRAPVRRRSPRRILRSFAE